jgi:hypothetical protein
MSAGIMLLDFFEIGPTSKRRIPSSSLDEVIQCDFQVERLKSKDHVILQNLHD